MIITTLNIDVNIDIKDYIKEAFLGDHTSFLIQRSYLKFECRESLELL